MSKLSGLFDQFKYLDQIPTIDISRWLTIKVDNPTIENFLGNRIIYPQTLPLTKGELELDLAILREAIKRQPEVLYQASTNKLVIPESYQNRFGSLEALIVALVEALNFIQVTYIYLKTGQSEKLIGSVIKPVIALSKDVVAGISVNNQKLGLRTGGITVLPFRDEKLIFKAEGGFQEVVASGGEFGLV